MVYEDEFYLDDVCIDNFVDIITTLNFRGIQYFRFDIIKSFIRLTTICSESGFMSRNKI